MIKDQQIIVSFSNNQRRLLSTDDVAHGRYLQNVPDNVTATIQLIAKSENSYLHTDEATDYLEGNKGDIAGDFNEVIANGCADDHDRRLTSRRLTEHPCFEVPNCANITEVVADVTEAPSLAPSNSIAPSSYPTETPSEKPSLVPSSSLKPTMEDPPSFAPSFTVSPSDVPTVVSSTKPSEEPSLQPSESPSERPSETPSVAPSSRPSRECPNRIERCYNGGIYSMYTCSCLCLDPYCPDSGNIDPLKHQCTKTTCPADYHETLFDDLPAPWFRFGSSCTSSKDFPSSITAIYHSKEDCCQRERPGDYGCMKRPAEEFQLSHNAKLNMAGFICPSSSSSQLEAIASTFALSIFSEICKESGVKCGVNDKVAVTSMCGYAMSAEAKYSSISSRRLATTDGLLEFTFSSLQFDPQTAKGIDAILTSYFSTSFTAFVTNVLADGKSNFVCLCKLESFFSVLAFPKPTSYSVF